MFAPLKFAELHSQSPLLTMAKRNKLSEKSKDKAGLKYSRTSTYGQLSITDSSFSPAKCRYILCENTLKKYGISLIRTTGTKSPPQRGNSYNFNLFITDKPVISSYVIQLTVWFAVSGQT